jgi:hypothetical protein
MEDFFDEQVRELDAAELLLLVVGAHLESETTDRALAYRLREEILAWQARAGGRRQPRPVVCSDLWYLNNQPLRQRPTVSIGRPEINAATAYLARRLPSALMIEQSYCIQLDPEYLDLNACIWGSDWRATAAAMDQFIERYLDDYLANVHQAAAGAG